MHQEIIAADFRNQFAALKALNDALTTRVAALEAAMGGKVTRASIGEFDPSFADPPTTADLQNIQVFLNQLTSALNR